MPSEMKRLKQLEEENQRLKKLVAGHMPEVASPTGFEPVLPP